MLLVSPFVKSTSLQFGDKAIVSNTFHFKINETKPPDTPYLKITEEQMRITQTHPEVRLAGTL